MVGYVIVPNTFQTPNNYVDKAMAMLTGEEYKCLSFAARHILGWQDKISKRRGFISLSMFEHGFVTANGVVFDGTGLTRETIKRATDELARLLFLIKIGEPTEDGQEWELGESPDFAALAARYEEKKAKRKLQTSKAREVRREGGLSDRPVNSGLFDRPEVVCSTYHRWFVQQTCLGLFNRLNQIHSQNHLQNQFKEDMDSLSNSKNSAVDPECAKQWAIAYSQLEAQIDRPSFESWVRGVQLVAVTDGVWHFQTKTQYAAHMLQHRLYREIRRVLSDVTVIPHDQIQLQFNAVQAVQP
jgi:hypothetical protein